MHDDRHPQLTAADRHRLVRAATRLLGPAEAEDAVQDAYLRALETAPQALNAAQAWLLTVMRHLAVDRLRRRQWMAQWLEALEADRDAGGPLSPSFSPSAETEAAWAQEAAQALRLLAARLSPADGAAVLLHEVFEVAHAELARAGGRTEAGSRQQLRRALARLRQGGGPAGPRPRSGGERTHDRARDRRGNRNPDPDQEAVFRLYLQALQLRNPQALWAMLRQPVVRALAGRPAARAATGPGAVQPGMRPAVAPVAKCGLVQAGGQLGLEVTLDGVTLCVLPLGVTDVADATADVIPSSA